MPAGTPGQSTPAPLETVTVFASLIEAELARGILESEGIAAEILDANIAGIVPHLSIAMGGVSLQVPRAQRAQAVALLREFLPDSG